MVSDTESPSRLTPRVSLRARVALTFALLGLVVSACVALVAVHFSDSYVHRLIEEMLRVEGDYLRERYAEDGRTPHPRTLHFSVFNDDATGRNEPPPDLKALAPGFHEVEDPLGERHIAVYDVNGQRLYVVLDIGLESKRERRLARDLIALVLFGTGLSAWLGWLWAGRAIEPVRRLAGQVEVLEPSRSGVFKLAPDFAPDEVGALAQAFDRYQEKLYEYVRRERAFTADASHELRTPLAVIRGALEVMLDSGQCDAATETRLKRMQRGSDELRDLLDALLLLARSDERDFVDSGKTDVDAVVGQLLRERTDVLNEKRVVVERKGAPGIVVPAPQRVLHTVIGNLLRAATQFAEGGTLSIAVTPAAVRIAHHQGAGGGPAPVHDVRSDGPDRILGLSMIRRVCERWGWTLDEGPGDGGDCSFTLGFGATGS